VRDTAFLADATSLWRGSARPPRDDVYVLYAGRIGVGRIAVLQAIDASGRGLVAVVDDHDVSFRHSRLRLDVVAPLRSTRTPVLAVPYDGNLAIPGLTSGPGSRILQLLVQPGITHVEERDLLAAANRTPRPSFVTRALDDGLSQPWLDLSGPLPFTAIRAYRDGEPAFTGVVSGTELQPVAVNAGVTEPPAIWSGLPRDVSPAVVVDDALWWAQVCRRPDVTVSPVWAGGVAGVDDHVRLELVTCAGRTPVAHWVTGIGAGSRSYDDRAPGAVDAYAMLLPSGSRPAIAVIGSTRVATIDLDSQVTRGRVAVAIVGDLSSVFVRAADGRLLRVG